MTDSRCIYPDAPLKKFENQKHQGSEYLIVNPTIKSPTRFGFELPCDRECFYRFGPYSGFQIRGVFECKNNVQAGDDTFTAVPLGDYDKIQLVPNWFEHCIKSVDVCYGNDIIRSSNVPRTGDIFLNTYLYSAMDLEIKDQAFPQKANPVYSVPTLQDGWSMNENSEWHSYSKAVFGRSHVEFHYVPSFVFPFYQPSDYQKREEQQEPILLPVQMLKSMSMNLNFTEKFDHIFKKSELNTKVYRFRVTSVNLCLEIASFQREFGKYILNCKGTRRFP